MVAPDIQLPIVLGERRNSAHPWVPVAMAASVALCHREHRVAAGGAGGHDAALIVRAADDLAHGPVERDQVLEPGEA